MATLGIFAMNAVSFSYVAAGYTNPSAAGIAGWWDVLIALTGEVLFDQKMMGMFSLLFGASLVLFVERAARHTAHPRRLSLWRNLLLLAVGAVHAWFWEGDVLLLYAALTPLVLVTLRLPPRWLLVMAGVTMAAAAGIVFDMATWIDPEAREGLAWWRIDHSEFSPATEGVMLGEAVLRALAMMWLGVVLYRSGWLTDGHARARSVRLARWGLSVGLPIATFAAAWMAASGFAVDALITAHGWNTIATIPMVLGYVGLAGVVPWGALRSRVISVGRMALTNYLAQTVIGLVLLDATLSNLVSSDGLPRSAVWLVVLAVWVLQLWWSVWWLARFSHGPLEWLWRMATYRRLMPIRR